MKTKDLKYELIGTDMEDIYQIKSLRNFSDVKKGDLGGYVHSEECLSHDGDCWVYDDSRVQGYLSDNAIVKGLSVVGRDSNVFGNSVIKNRSNIYGICFIYGNIVVDGGSVLGNNVCLSGDSVIDKDNGYITFSDKTLTIENFTYTFSDKRWHMTEFYGDNKMMMDEILEHEPNIDKNMLDRLKKYFDFVENIQ